MAHSSPTSRQIRFGEFTLDLDTAELRSNGRSSTLQGQPFQILLVLLERPGRLVTREELKKQLWPSDTFVDFDHGLNKAINRLREALDDSADHAKFIETLPRRGYRFIGTLEAVPPRSTEAAMARSAMSGNDDRGHAEFETATARSKLRLTVTAVLLLAPLLVIAGLFLFRFRPPETRQLVRRELTANPNENPVIGGVISPDGKQLAYVDRENGLSLLQIDTGEKRSFPGTSSLYPEAWFPDGAHLLLSDSVSGGAWKMSTLDGTQKKILDESVNFRSASVSPDGAQIAFNPESNFSEIWIMGANGENPHRIVSIEPSLTGSPLAWSPTSRRIMYWRCKVQNGGVLEAALESCNRDGRECVSILSDLRLLIGFEGGPDAELGLSWAADGRVFYTLAEPPPSEFYGNIWSIAVDPDTGRAQGRPSRVTNWIHFWGFGFSHSVDGKRLAFMQLNNPSTPKVAEVPNPGRLGPSRPLVDDNWDKFVTGWTSDSRSVLFESNPQGRWGIFKQNVQTHETQTLLSGPDSYENAVVSPDGQWLLFTEYSSNDLKGESARLMRMRVTGDSPTLVVRGKFSYQCASQAKLCVLSEVTGNRRVFSILDPIVGRGAELAHAEPPTGDYRWSLSPDGKRIAFVPVYNGHNGNHIQILDLATGSNTRAIELKVGDLINTRVQSVAWASDSRHFYVSAGTLGTRPSFAIYWVSPDGELTKLVEMLGATEFLFGPKPSPDGHYLAYFFRHYQTNVTMLENY